MSSPHMPYATLGINLLKKHPSRVLNSVLLMCGYVRREGWTIR
jgi:hypothetical protein